MMEFILLEGLAILSFFWKKKRLTRILTIASGIALGRFLWRLLVNP